MLGGQAAVNYAGTAGGRQIFVKTYLPGTDQTAEESAIELSEYAAASRVRTAPGRAATFDEPDRAWRPRGAQRAVQRR